MYSFSSDFIPPWAKAMKRPPVGFRYLAQGEDSDNTELQSLDCQRVETAWAYDDDLSKMDLCMLLGTADSQLGTQFMPFLYRFLMQGWRMQDIGTMKSTHLLTVEGFPMGKADEFVKFGQLFLIIWKQGRASSITL